MGHVTKQQLQVKYCSLKYKMQLKETNPEIHLETYHIHNTLSATNNHRSQGSYTLTDDIAMC